jgi:hypothetical protein
MPSTHPDNGTSMDGSQEMGPMKLNLLIFSGLEEMADLVAVEDARFESGDSRLLCEEDFFHPPK